MDSPLTFFALCAVALWVSAQAGLYFRRTRRERGTIAPADLTTLLTATLTLLALIIGFTFTMAVAEFDQRRNLEEAEANAIDTAYVRARFAPVEDAAKIRELLRQYLRQRVLFYASHDAEQLEKVDTATARLQENLWSVAEAVGTTKPNPIGALVISGIDDVSRAQISAQAARRNRVPLEAWLFMGAVAICGNFLLGYTARCHQMTAKRFLVLPLLVSIAFFLLADLDNPRHGIISVNPQNLTELSRSM